MKYFFRLGPARFSLALSIFDITVEVELRT